MKLVKECRLCFRRNNC